MIYKVGDIIHTKKPHACKSTVWEVVRDGADYKIKCTGCQRVVMLTPEELKKIVKKVERQENV